MGILQVYYEAEGNNAQEGLCAEKVFSECLLKKSFIPVGMLAGRQNSPACYWSGQKWPSKSELSRKIWKHSLPPNSHGTLSTRYGETLHEQLCYRKANRCNLVV